MIALSHNERIRFDSRGYVCLAAAVFVLSKKWWYCLGRIWARCEFGGISLVGFGLSAVLAIPDLSAVVAATSDLVAVLSVVQPFRTKENVAWIFVL